MTTLSPSLMSHCYSQRQQSIVPFNPIYLSYIFKQEAPFFYGHDLACGLLKLGFKNLKNG